MKYSAEEFSMAGDKYLGCSYKEIDCQELVERMMADIGYRKNLGGSNSWYRECMKNGWTGTPEECLREFGTIPKGAILFICEPVSASTPEKFRNDGIGDVSHMGVKTGRGDGAIHSSRSKGCVCTSVFRDRAVPNGGWNRVGLLNVFSYGKEEKRMKGTVTAKSGSMVRLRQKPSINCPVWWNIPVGTELEVTGQQGNWSKCVCGSLTGWMKNEFIRSGGEEASATPETEAGEGVSLPEDSGPEEALALLAEVYRTLKETCERIMNVIGRG